MGSFLLLIYSSSTKTCIDNTNKINRRNKSISIATTAAHKQEQKASANERYQ